jgi:hypothetical protein
MRARRPWSGPSTMKLGTLSEAPTAKGTTISIKAE